MRSNKPPSMSARLKLQKFRFAKDASTKPEKPKLTPDQVKKLFKNWK